MDKVLIVTATEVESQEVAKQFSQAAGTECKPCFIGCKSYFPFGNVGGIDLFMAQSEMGSGTPGGALQTVSECVRDLSPIAVIMVGICFGTKPDKQKIGDIVVSKQLHLYEPKKATGKRPIPRGDTVTASVDLLDKFRSGRLSWGGAQVHFGLMLSGEKLVNDRVFLKKMLDLRPEAIGGEMEGAGLYIAASKAGVDWIMVKAICDWGDGNKTDDYQREAARNAATFVLHIVQLGGLQHLRLSGNQTGEAPSAGASVAEKTPVAKQLRENPQNAMSPIVEISSRDIPISDPVVDIEWAKQVRSTFHERLRNGQFEGMDTSDGTLAITVIPGRKPSKRIDVASFEKFLWKRLHPISAGGWDRRRGPRYFGTVARDGYQGPALDVTEFTDEKVLLAANLWLVHEHGLTDKLSDRFGEVTRGIYPARIEKVAVEALTKYFSMLRDVPVRLPWLISVAILDLGPTAARSTDIRHYSSGDVVFRDRDIVPDFIEVSGDDAFSNKNQVARLLRPALNFIWRAFGYQGSPYFDSDGDWHG